MTTATDLDPDVGLPKTEAAIGRAHLALRDLQRILAERLLAEQESYLALERDYQILKAERDALAARLDPAGETATAPMLPHPPKLAPDPSWRAEVDQALALVDQALDLLAPDLKTKVSP